ncbi:MAG: glycosyltransferase [Geobacteraceae bacterium]|nr:glycosyltransferase [Geobacteraceae bacterium]
MKSIAFFVYPVLRFPRNNRQYFLTEELLARGWHVIWLVPKSGINEGVPVDDHILHYDDLNIRGRTYLLPIYLGLMLRAKGIKYFWLSGWVITAARELSWLVRILRVLGIETIYDTIDPVCEFKLANRELSDSDAKSKCHKAMNSIYGLCKRVLCVTPEMKELLARNGADESRLIVARWGVDRNVFNRAVTKGDLRSKLGIDKNIFLVGWLGSMTEFKGLREMLLPLVERLAGEGKIHFLIAGDGPLFGEVKAWVASLKKSAVTLLGRVPYGEAAEFTAALDAYLVTTNPDSEYARAICPIKCYDAIAMGTPLVTTRTPATEHLERMYGNVHLCDYDIDSLEKAVREIADDIEDIGKSGNKKLNEVVSQQGVSCEIADMLEDLAEGRN